MADFKLGRIKFKWRGDWAVSTAYLVDDIVKQNDLVITLGAGTIWRYSELIVQNLKKKTGPKSCLNISHREKIL